MRKKVEWEYNRNLTKLTELLMFYFRHFIDILKLCVNVAARQKIKISRLMPLL